MAAPKHIAVSMENILELCSRDNAAGRQCYEKCFRLLGNLLELQVKSGIPILTVYLLPENAEKFAGQYMDFCNSMADFFSNLCSNANIPEHRIKISVFGKWYNLPGKAVESLKKAIEYTKENDNFFANFCINYDGQEEIVDACKLVAKQVELGKMAPEMITKESVRENIYSSYFMPPDVILIYGERRLSGLLLWDSVKSRIVFTGKPFMEFEEEDIKNLCERHLTIR